MVTDQSYAGQPTFTEDYLIIFFILGLMLAHLPILLDSKLALSSFFSLTYCSLSLFLSKRVYPRITYLVYIVVSQSNELRDDPTALTTLSKSAR
ncbi:hypothetical protein L218DRAFT_314910 [Marasmius fiardii PR-910]|nr:hypothetical protein L218DRAFT_314910 [Marasmius fiardii PR-910]